MADTLIHTWTLGDRLRKARMEAGFGSSELAVRLETSRTTISNYENDRTVPDAYMLRKWARATTTSVDWLLGDDDQDLITAQYPELLAA